MKFKTCETCPHKIKGNCTGPEFYAKETGMVCKRAVKAPEVDGESVRREALEFAKKLTEEKEDVAFKADGEHARKTYFQDAIDHGDIAAEVEQAIPEWVETVNKGR